MSYPTGDQSSPYGASPPPSTGGGVPPIPQAPQQGYADAPVAPSYGGQYSGTGYGTQGYGGYGGPPVPATRPGTVTAGGVMAIIGGAVLAVFGVIFFAIGASGVAENEMGLGEISGYLSVLGGIVCPVGVLVLVLGVLTLRGRFWAAITLTVIGGLWVLLSIASIFAGQAQVMFGLAYVGVAVGLLLAPTSRAWLRRPR